MDNNHDNPPEWDDDEIDFEDIAPEPKPTLRQRIARWLAKKFPEFRGETGYPGPPGSRGDRGLDGRPGLHTVSLTEVYQPDRIHNPFNLELSAEERDKLGRLWVTGAHIKSINVIDRTREGVLRVTVDCRDESPLRGIQVTVHMDKSR